MELHVTLCEEKTTIILRLDVAKKMDRLAHFSSKSLLPLPQPSLAFFLYSLTPASVFRPLFYVSRLMLSWSSFSRFTYLDAITLASFVRLPCLESAASFVPGVMVGHHSNAFPFTCKVSR
ncbi:hypothetical protein V6N13_139097 [Hibiscus sabdariffa]|uniref:Uncharacterized protein n=1 Tax=Hibiscus sabdariffa TaxID=183260 RepID=A0ABR2PKS1_9ROSI